MQHKPNTYERYGNFIINKTQPLGAGSYGHVWKGYVIGPNQSLQPAAIKESFYHSQNIKQIQTLQILKHPNIVRYIDYKISGNSVFMVMQLCESGTLEDLLYDMVLSTQKIIQYYSQIVKGIKFMYNKNILHRDIKPSNFLVKKNKIKIADFGTSKIDKTQNLKTLVGTPLFYSPQLFQMSFGSQDTYTEKSDIWALGLILYLMFNYDRESTKASDRLKNSLPWKGRNTSQLFHSITKDPIVFRKQEQTPEEIKKIIVKMLKVDATQRMSFDEFFEIELFKSEKSLKDLQLQNAEERTINFIKRETIGWDLLELIELKQNENTNEQERQECRQFYELLIDQLSQVYNIENYELLFELEVQYYQLTKDEGEKERIINKYYQRKNLFQQFMTESSIQKSQEPDLKNESGILIAYEPKLQTIMPLPSEKLINEIRHYIKCNVGPLLKQNSSIDSLSLSTSQLSSTKYKQQRCKILFIYDLFTLLTLEKSWQIKRKSKLRIDDYKRARKAVGIDKIVSRIRKASEVVPIN